MTMEFSALFSGAPKSSLGFCCGARGAILFVSAKQQNCLTAKKQIPHPRSPETDDRVRDDNGLQGLRAYSLCLAFMSRLKPRPTRRQRLSSAQGGLPARDAAPVLRRNRRTAGDASGAPTANRKRVRGRCEFGIEASLRSRDDAEVALTTRSRRAFYDDLDVSAKQGQEVHEPLGGEAGKLTPQKARNLGLIDLQYVGGASLSESPRANSLGDTDREIGFRETLFRVGQTDVGEDVAAAFLDLNSLRHGSATPF
jgi:hypothetical protein